ncbi:hypothetical protein YC2023_108661 [Brassica napus]
MRELQKGIRLKFQNRDVAVDGNVRESGDVSKVNSLWSMEQCRQGKSAKWIRNFGKRIGSEGWARGSQFRTPANVAIADRLVSAGGRTGTSSFGSFPRASNSQLRTGTDKGNPTV